MLCKVPRRTAHDQAHRGDEDAKNLAPESDSRTDAGAVNAFHGNQRLDIVTQLDRPSDFYETLQMLTGAYLVFFIPRHINSVFVFQRTSWRKTLISGLPQADQRVGNPWSVRLLPHYALAV